MEKPERQKQPREVRVVKGETVSLARTMPSRKRIVVVFVVLNVVDRSDDVVGESGSFRNTFIEPFEGFRRAKKSVELGGDSSENSN